MTRPEIRRRPGQATFTAILLLLFGAAYTLGGVALLGIMSDAADHGESVSAVAYVPAVVQIVVALAQIASGVFVLAGMSWARTLAIVVCGATILGAVFVLFSGSWIDALGGITVNAVLIGMLNRDDVRDWCG